MTGHLGYNDLLDYLSSAWLYCRTISYSRREYISMNIVAIAFASSLLTYNLLPDGGTKACQPAQGN